LPTPAPRSATAAIGAGVFLCALAVYTLTCTPSCPWWDSGEFIAASKVLGIPHPPGTPLYVLIGRLFALLPFGTVAWRVNWLSALASAGAVLFTFLLAVRLIRLCQGRARTRADEIAAWMGGVAAACFTAFSHTFWTNAIEAEVYALSSLVQVVILYLGIRWWEGLGRGEGDNRLLAAWYLCFLCVGVHLGTFLVLPSIVLLVVLVSPRSLFAPRNLAWAAGLALAGLSVHAYLMLRAHANPPVNEGDPESWKALVDLVLRRQYGPRPIEPRLAPWSYQIAMYGRFLFEQFTLSAKLGALGSAIPLALGAAGAVAHARREARSFAMLALAFLLTSLALVVYLNLTTHEEPERDYFFVTSFQIVALWIGMALALGLGALARRRPATLVPASAAVLAFSLLPLAHHFFTHDRRGFYVARDYAWNTLTPLAPGALLFTHGDNDTFPLWYLQQVEGVRTDVRVINLYLANADWYIRELRDEEPRVPTSITDPEIAVVPTGFLHDAASGASVPVNRWLVYDILRKASGRPVYFTVTSPDHFGLDSLLALEGLVWRIAPGQAGRDSSLGWNGTSWIDAARTRDNLDRVFLYRGLFDADGRLLARPYKDPHSLAMTQNYAAARMELAWDDRRRGDLARGIDDLQRVDRMYPDFPPAQGLLGLFYFEAGDTAASRAYFRERERGPVTADLFYYDGYCLGRMGRIDEAVGKLAIAARMDPGDVQALETARDLLRGAGRVTEAEAIERRIEERRSTGPGGSPNADSGGGGS
jgi:Protein O-mannosyl-transferase TMEM260-like